MALVGLFCHKFPIVIKEDPTMTSYVMDHNFPSFPGMLLALQVGLSCLRMTSLSMTPSGHVLIGTSLL
jgi:hypothetical protein